MEWTSDEKDFLKKEGFTTYDMRAYFGPHCITKGMGYRFVDNVRVDFVKYEAVTESIERDVDGDPGPTWTHLSYESLEEAAKRVKGVLFPYTYKNGN